MPIPRRYGVQDTVYFPMVKRAVVDFATSSDWTPVQSDTRVQIDTASASYATNLVTATGSRWALILTAAELTGKKIGVTIIDAATKAVEDQDIEIETYGSPLAQQGFDYTVATITLSQPALDQAAVQIVNTVWATGSRTLSSFGTLQGDVVNAVWATPSRTLTSLGTGVIDATSIADSGASEIAIAVWATASRTLSSFGTLQGDIVNTVWATPSRTLTSLGTGVIDATSIADSGASEIAMAVWATGSRTLSSFGTLQGDVVNAVWATPSRTLSSFGTLQGDVVNAVWATPSRTITGTGTDAIAAASIAAAAGSKIADIVLRRTAANARASADGDAASFRTLLGGVSKLVNLVQVNGPNLEIMQENDTTVYGTQVITTDSAAAPITKLDTV